MSSSNCCFLTCIQFLRRQVRWSDIPIGSITKNKASGDYGIPVELFQILKDEAVKVLHSICQQIWKNQQWLRTGKGQFSFQSQRKAISLGLPSKVMLKSSKVMLKILQARLQQYMNHELPDVQAGLEKAEEPEIKLPTSVGSWKKQENFRKTSISASLTVLNY